MAENVTPEMGTPPTSAGNRAGSPNPHATQNTAHSRGHRPRLTGTQSSTSRDFEGATPKIGGILALRSENVTKKVNYDAFCEKLGIYVMNDLKNGDAIVEVTRTPNADIMADFAAFNKPKDLDKSIT